jgi:diaminopimelate epimerase
MTPRPFIKMHGLGNDFVVVDARREPFVLDEAEARAVADRRAGVGCDQLIVMEPATNGAADVFMRIRNADGGEVEACGNATRCVAALVMAETGQERCTVETRAGLLRATRLEADRIAVDMGELRTAWQDIPLAREMDTLHLDLACGPLRDPVAVNIGNPHAVFFVDDAEAVDLAALGPRLEHDPLFPERANIGVAQLTGPDRLRVRVWERGVGLTRACGTGACAAAAAAHRRGLTGRSVDVRLDGGVLALAWREDGHMVMTGPASTSFTGVFAESLLP